MLYVIVTIHVVVCIAMIGIVLLQSGKGASMGASFGAGGSQTVFGASGGSTFMSKLTTGAAIIFMLTSLSLAYLSRNPGSSSIMSSGVPKPAAPAQQTAPMPSAPQMPVGPLRQTAPTVPGPQMPAVPATPVQAPAK
ncbi:MAG: preprotein translocase subunit SecG [Desulfuromonadales bacterium]|nr:preprotein translocase subunit SecG [Desulfuromonadales bacterium]